MVKTPATNLGDPLALYREWEGEWTKTIPASKDACTLGLAPIHQPGNCYLVHGAWLSTNAKGGVRHKHNGSVNTHQEIERVDETYTDQWLFTAVMCFSGRQGSLSIRLGPT